MADYADLRRTCSEFRQLNRRSFVKAGVLGSGGLTLGQLLRSDAQAARNAGAVSRRDKSVIILWMRGGPSHIDMWDPKPDAPSEYRGEFDTIGTSVPGINLTHMLPNSAKLMHKWSIVRSLHHHDAGHSTGDQLCFTGYNSGPIPDANVHPSCGSIVAEQLGHERPEMPAYVMIPKMDPGTGPAYLGVKYRPFETLVDPADPGPFNLPSFQLNEGLSVDRLQDRRKLQLSLDRMRRQVDVSGQMDALDKFDQQALDMLLSPAAAKAFNLDAEPQNLRDAYGFHPKYDPMDPRRCSANAFCQRVLLARRLVEAGVRLVTVDLRWWDTHVQGFDSLRKGFLPKWETCFPALIEDMERRGMMKNTLVVAWGEFGRTPMVNKDAGRDHYPNVFSAALFGGKIQGGRVVGSSDSKGAFPKDNPKTPQDVLATIYDHLGIDVTKNYLDHAGRPHPVLPSGEPIRELF